MKKKNLILFKLIIFTLLTSCTTLDYISLEELNDIEKTIEKELEIKINQEELDCAFFENYEQVKTCYDKDIQAKVLEKLNSIISINKIRTQILLNLLEPYIQNKEDVKLKFDEIKKYKQ